jgi:hypothetical protein
MIGELDVLRIVSERLDAAQIPYMLTGSYALAFYTTPRMTRDLDLVILVVFLLWPQYLKWKQRQKLRQFEQEQRRKWEQHRRE